jgi:chromosome segregation ATPase
MKVFLHLVQVLMMNLPHRCELFNKAYNHISDRIDQVYKDLTKGKASPMGGVAYLSLEDSEVSRSHSARTFL